MLVGGKSIWPWISVEDCVNFFQVIKQPRERVLDRARKVHLSQRNSLGFGKCLIETFGDPWVTYMRIDSSLHANSVPPT